MNYLKIPCLAFIFHTLFILACYLFLGAPEMRVLFLTCFLSGLIHPILPLYMIGGLGWMYLANPGSQANNVSIDLLVAGSICGYAIRCFLDPEQLRPLLNRSFRPFLFLIGAIAILLLGSSVYGISLSIHDSRFSGMTPLGIFSWILNDVVYHHASESTWVFRCLVTWSLGLGVVMVAFRYGDHWTISRFYKMAFIGTAIACVLGLFNLLHHRTGLDFIITDYFLHGRNTDPLQAGRFYGTAGHAGWFAQWLILTLPAIFLLGTEKKSARIKTLVGIVFLVMILCLFLTAARAAWLALIVMAILVFASPLIRKKGELSLILSPRGMAYGASIIVLGMILSWNVLSDRFLNLLNATDRVNYFYSARDLLFHHPLGIGLGTHYETYKSEITPFYFAAQSDFLNTHNFILHLLVENGPILVLPVILFLFLIFRTIFRNLTSISSDNRMVLGVLTLSLSGILVIGIAQYILYIKSVEFFFWITIGFIFSLIFKNQDHVASGKTTHYATLAVFILSIPVAFVTGLSHFNRDAGKSELEHWSVDIEGEDILATKWLSEKTGFLVDRSVESIEFKLIQYEVENEITLKWPDGMTETVQLQPGETREFRRTLNTGSNSVFLPSNWMEIISSNYWIPAETLENNPDRRRLAVYLQHLKME